MSVDELTRAVTAAHTLGRETMIHCSGNDGVQNCIAARVDTIEHGFFIDRDQLARLRDLNIAWIPTFAPVHFQWEHGTALGWSELVRSNLRRILDDHAARLREAGELGVRIIAGSDAGSHGVPHGYGFFTELEIMEAAGLSTLQVLRSATGASAGRLGLREDQGRLRIGARSRFLLTDAQVLQSVRHLRQPLTVVFDHAVFSGGDVSTKPGL
jgi:imidazolonepropionase-like amidohydrolase